MRTTAFLLAGILIAVPALVGNTFAADKSTRLEPLPNIPPPPGMVDPDMEPQITITQRGDDRIEEFRVKGRLYMIKVTPPHGKAYFLIDQRGDGQMRKYDDLSPNFQVPLWVIHTF
ncbi:MAG: DUF2782 domain-containing protein [Pseudomonadota bacterium]|nr:DUF2782 domain-containing protein [Pseudomonadota bacterium]